MSLVQYGCILLLIFHVSESSLFSSQMCNHVCFQDNSQDQCDICSSHYSDEAADETQRAFALLKERDCALADPKDYPKQYDPKDGEEFDIIIVGAGSAGCVMANRLSETPELKVLLLEAGGNPTKTSEVPALLIYSQGSDIDWRYQSLGNEDNCLGMNDNKCNIPRGKVLGGSSALNNMLYVRGHPRDYDDWKAEGNPGWGYEDVLPYFKKLEDMRDKKLWKSPTFPIYHNKGGPLKVEAYPNKYLTPIIHRLSEGLKTLGYHTNYDVNGSNQTGYVMLQGTLEYGKRCSTAKAYLTPIKNRKNLKVSKHSLVTKILINRHKKAYGVRFTDFTGNNITVRAKKEVILSAGAINSAQLLMLSGIGPVKELKKFNIPVIKNLSVGNNLQDHSCSFNVLMTLDYDETTVEPPEKRMIDFLLSNDSEYSTFGLGTTAWMTDSLEIYMFNMAKNDSRPLKKLLSVFNVRDEIKTQYYNINRQSYTIVFLISLLKFFSRGSVQLSSNDPKTSPKIKNGYFTNKKDTELLLEAYGMLKKLADTESLKQMNAKIHEIDVPACKKYQVASRKYRECSLRHLTTTTYHQCGTCKMGPAHSPDSVVDPQLRVKGIGGLRVVDAGVFPKIPRGNINAPVIMVAEKISDLIKSSLN